MTSYALRVPDHIMEQARDAAAEDKVSINQMLVSFIAEDPASIEIVPRIRSRGERPSSEPTTAGPRRQPPPD